MDSITVKIELTREVGLVKAVILSYIAEISKHQNEGICINGRELAKTFPMSKSTIYKAINDLVIDTYLVKTSDSTYRLSETFLKKFPQYNIFLL